VGLRHIQDEELKMTAIQLFGEESNEEGVTGKRRPTRPLGFYAVVYDFTEKEV
jgi:hypothetical protein